MTDTRPKALEKARQRGEKQTAQTIGSLIQAKKPPGTGFETERQKAKQALRDDVNRAAGQNVQKFAAAEESAQGDRILRVAAYCRVSTDDIDQVKAAEEQLPRYDQGKPQVEVCRDLCG